MFERLSAGVARRPTAAPVRQRRVEDGAVRGEQAGEDLGKETNVDFSPFPARARDPVFPAPATLRAHCQPLSPPSPFPTYLYDDDDNLEHQGFFSSQTRKHPQKQRSQRSRKPKAESHKRQKGKQKAVRRQARGRSTRRKPEARNQKAGTPEAQRTRSHKSGRCSGCRRLVFWNVNDLPLCLCGFSKPQSCWRASCDVFPRRGPERPATQTQPPRQENEHESPEERDEDRDEDRDEE